MTTIEESEEDLQSKINELKAEIEKLRGALEEIAEGKGRYDMDPVQHCKNTVEDLVGLAKVALNKTG